jgi:hypothetical protein
MSNVFDVAATGKLSDEEGDVVTIRPLNLASVKSRENVGGEDGFNQFAKADSKIGVNKIQGFNSAAKKLNKVKIVASAMERSIRKLALDGRKAFNAVVKATAKTATSATATIRRMADAGRLARRAAARAARKIARDAKKLVAGTRATLRGSFDVVRSSVSSATRTIAGNNIIIGRTKDASAAMQNIIMGELRKSGKGVRQLSKGLEQMGGLVGGNVGARLGEIAKLARGALADARSSVSGVIRQVGDQVQNIRRAVDGAKRTVTSVNSVAASINRDGLNGGLTSLASVSKSDGASKNGGDRRRLMAALGPVGWSVGAGSALLAIGPAIGRSVGRISLAVGNLFSCLFGCGKRNERLSKREEAARRASCLEWITTGRQDGKVLTYLPAIAARDWMCRNDVVPPTRDTCKQGSLEQGFFCLFCLFFFFCFVCYLF